MNFNSPQYLVFFTVVLVVYVFVAARPRLRELFLLGASYFFYMSWKWEYAGLMALSTVVDYTMARMLDIEQRPARRKTLLTVSLVLNLGMLGIFKYYNFFIDQTGNVLGLFGLHPTFLRSELLLPVGISFYTFHTLGYVIDVYRRKMGSEKDFIRFALFVSFFPQLVAGPILRAVNFLPQMRVGPNITQSRFQTGLLMIFQGLIKKILIADLLSWLLVDDVFSNPTAFSSWEVMMALYGYAFQIYNDFSGYSDIAIGSARMLGFDIPINFNQPYLSATPREFWSRWHISLSTWLRDYLYISLGGNQRGERRTLINLMLTMLLGGLWHGASLNFVFWGAYHGALLVVTHVFLKNFNPTGVRLWISRLVCFHLVVFGWLLFRVSNMEQFSEVLSSLGNLTMFSRIHPLFYCVLGFGVATHLISDGTLDAVRERWSRLPAPVLGGAMALLLLIFCGASSGTPSFIYFQF